MPSKNENNKILAECAKVFKLGYCPDFFFLGCVKDGTEEVEVKLERERIGSMWSNSCLKTPLSLRSSHQIQQRRKHTQKIS